MKPLVRGEGSSGSPGVPQPTSFLPVGTLVLCRLLSDMGTLKVKGVTGACEISEVQNWFSLLGYKDSKTECSWAAN